MVLKSKILNMMGKRSRTTKINRDYRITERADSVVITIITTIMLAIRRQSSRRRAGRMNIE